MLVLVIRKFYKHGQSCGLTSLTCHNDRLIRRVPKTTNLLQLLYLVTVLLTLFKKGKLKSTKNFVPSVTEEHQ